MRVCVCLAIIRWFHMRRNIVGSCQQIVAYRLATTTDTCCQTTKTDRRHLIQSQFPVVRRRRKNRRLQLTSSRRVCICTFCPWPASNIVGCPTTVEGGADDELRIIIVSNKSTETCRLPPCLAPPVWGRRALEGPQAIFMKYRISI